jgi:hypothetical protein
VNSGVGDGERDPRGDGLPSRNAPKSTPAQFSAKKTLTRGSGARKVSRSFWPPTHKRCSNCSAWLPLEAFTANRRRHLGRSSWCRACTRAATREWRAANPGYAEAYNERRRREYRSSHPLRERDCVVCGRPFTNRPDAIVCGDRCRRKRKAEQRKRLRQRAEA